MSDRRGIEKAELLRKEINDLGSDLMAIGPNPKIAAKRCAKYGHRLIEADLLVATVVGFCPEGLLFESVPFANDEEKRERTYSAAVALGEAGASLAMVIAETWLSKNANAVRPSADPDRSEALTVNAVNPDGTVAAMLVNPFEHTSSGIKWRKPINYGGPDKKQYFLPAWAGLVGSGSPFVN